MNYKPADLPDADEIWLYLIGGHTDRPFVTTFDMGEKSRHIVHAAKSFTGHDAASLLAMLRGLPPSSPGRCHFPRIAMKFVRENLLLLSVTVCWQCCNIVIHGEEMAGQVGFDADSDAARTLLDFCKAVFAESLSLRLSGEVEQWT